MPAWPTTGWFSLVPPSLPLNGASPNANTPPSDATARYAWRAIVVGPCAPGSTGISTEARSAQPNGGGPSGAGASLSGGEAVSHIKGELNGSTLSEPSPAGSVTVWTSDFVCVVHFTESPLPT